MNNSYNNNWCCYYLPTEIYKKNLPIIEFVVDMYEAVYTVLWSEDRYLNP